MTEMLLFTNPEVMFESAYTLFTILACVVVYAIVKGHVENKRWESEMGEELIRRKNRIWF